MRVCVQEKHGLTCPTMRCKMKSITFQRQEMAITAAGKKRHSAWNNNLSFMSDGFSSLAISNHFMNMQIHLISWTFGHQISPSKFKSQTLYVHLALSFHSKTEDLMSWTRTKATNMDRATAAHDTRQTWAETLYRQKCSQRGWCVPSQPPLFQAPSACTQGGQQTQNKHTLKTQLKTVPFCRKLLI